MKLSIEHTTVAAAGASRPGSLDDWLTKKQTAELLQVSSRQVQRWIAEGRLQASRLSHKVLRIRRQSVERLLNRSAL